MWRRRISNWSSTHQKGMVAGMFCLMASGIVWLVAGRGEAGRSFDDTAKLLYSGFNKEQQTSPVTTDVLEAWRIYSQMQAIDPDSLTARDSSSLKHIDQQLNRIIHE